MINQIERNFTKPDFHLIMKENLKQKKIRAARIIQALRKAIPDRQVALQFKTPLELLLATILSAQCTDKRVNIVTASLFKKYKTAKDYAAANLKTFELEIRSTGFYKTKAKNIINAAKALVERFGGKVPSRMEDLVTLPGVGRKTANVVLGNAFGIPGIAVDTHVKRVAFRLNLTAHTDPGKIENDLNEIIPQKDWVELSHLLIWHGRLTCFARKPNCKGCGVNRYCPSRQDIL